MEQGILVTACPGPSAVLTGLALSGLPTDRFLFAGFVPQKQGERKRLFEEFAKLKATLIFFESPHRIVETLHDVGAALAGRSIAVTRELTKLHEEVLRGTAQEVAATLEARASVKGEITLLIGPRRKMKPSVKTRWKTPSPPHSKQCPPARPPPRSRSATISTARTSTSASSAARTATDARPQGRGGSWPHGRDGAALVPAAERLAAPSRRYKCAFGEVDLIMRKGETTAFIEVKSRATLDGAVESVSPRQARRISAAARSFLGQDRKAHMQACRFDIVAVSPYHWPRHIANAFDGDQ